MQQRQLAPQPTGPAGAAGPPASGPAGPGASRSGSLWEKLEKGGPASAASDEQYPVSS